MNEAELVEKIEEAEAAANHAPPEPNKFEVRGYEVCKLKADGSWEQVGKYRPTEIALAHANSTCKWLQERNRKLRYTVRALVSCELPKEIVDGPLVLEADDSPTPQTAVQPEESPAVEPPDSNPYGMLKEFPIESTPSYEEGHPEVNA